MQNETYKIIFTGKIVSGYEIDTVKKNLAHLFRVNIDRIERLFTGHSMLIKDKLNLQTATTYEQTLKKAGAICRVERDQVPPPTAHLTKSVKAEKGKSGGGKLLIKRLVFGIAWFMILYLAACFVAGFIAGFFAGYGAGDPASAKAAGATAGAAIINQYGSLLLFGALAFAILGTVFGILPGTRKRAASQ